MKTPPNDASALMHRLLRDI